MKRLLTSSLTCFLLIPILFQSSFETRAARILAISPLYKTYHPIFFKDYSNTNSAITMLNRSVMEVTAMLNFNGGQVTSIQTIPAGQALRLSGAEISELPSNFAGPLAISSNGQLETTVEITKSGAYSGDTLAIYRGQSSGSSQLYLGPYFKGAAVSSIVVMNVSAASATTSWTFLDMSGNPVASQTVVIPYGYTVTIFTGSLTQIPAGTQGVAVITSNQPVVGLVLSQSLSSGMYQWFETYEAMPAGLQLFFPRLLKSLDEGCGSRSSSVMITNSGSSAAAYALSFYHADGSLAITYSFASLPAGQSRLARLADQAGLNTGESYSAVLTGSGSASAQDITEFDVTPTCASGDYTVSSGAKLDLPRVERTTDGFSIIHLQNLGAAPESISLDLYQAKGTLVYTTATTAQPGAAFSLNLDSLNALDKSYSGYAVITSSGPAAAAVDQMGRVPCQAASNAILEYDPTSDIYPGTKVHFTATADGDAPFSYAWQVDGAPGGHDQDTLDWTFASVGNHPVTVTVSDACGQASAGVTVPVVSNLPDLTQSGMIANLNSVSAGDLLTYTIFLRNTGILTATATFTDPIPAHTAFSNFRYGSGQAKVNLDSQVMWSGPVIAGSPVVLELGVVVSDTIVGTLITNTAQLDDGAGGLTVLKAESMFNPGYSLSIDYGIIATNVPTVTLRYSWNSADNITQVRFSNDGGFGAEGSTTAFLPVDAANPVYTGWVLATLGDLRIPRVVYVKFRDAGGTQFGPFSDDIIYDIDQPTIQRIEVLPSTGTQTHPSSSAVNVTIRVTASDANSGVGLVEVSNSASFSGCSVFTVSGQVTDIPWTIKSYGIIYIRVADRAGNLSDVDKIVGSDKYYVFLPAVMK